MKIGVDIDGVLVDFVSGFLQYYNLKYGTDLKYNDATTYYMEEAFGLPQDKISSIMNEYLRSHAFVRMQLIPGSKEAIGNLSSRHSLHIITARSSDIYDRTVGWLHHNFPGCFSKILFSNSPGLPKMSKAAICKQQGVSILVEDSLENALTCSAAGVTVFLMDCPWNQRGQLPENVIRVSDWQEIVETLQKEERFLTETL
ncbi:hypothetical protein COV20_03355 [Candidatus Woesearchaeota archaeon CG10_big_fil_rev_8_21_14_0_10_45_16]|nr:MAG: hypothetical protein COV20_03355 [Candidatus Woesearchaeota archaeon CG10_big_fil_rev_8_21_14_0_10_45_16]